MTTKGFGLRLGLRLGLGLGLCTFVPFYFGIHIIDHIKLNSLLHA
jgi:hypothetical protein